MKLLIAAFLCLAAVWTAYAQSDGNGASSSVSKTTLARKESDGTITENPEKFRPTDIPIICYVDLTEDQPVEVKISIIAVRAVGLRPESKIVNVAYRTKAGENAVTFNVRPEGRWAAGSYRADVFLNGKAADSVSFEVAGEK